jgi:hypothetical protein
METLLSLVVLIVPFLGVAALVAAAVVTIGNSTGRRG